MKYLEVTENTKLSEISDIVGERNVDYVINANGIKRSVNIGKQIIDRDFSGQTDWQTKVNILNTLVSNSDVYEKAALSDDKDWNALNRYGTFSNYLKIPDEISIPPSTTILGNDEPVDSDVYDRVLDSLAGESHDVDPGIFSEFSDTVTFGHGITTEGSEVLTKTPFEWFKLPWGKVTLYSSMYADTVDFPVYPEEYSDGYSANYDQMPNMLYQYEPWFVYKDTGPRTNTLTFKMHRDMWTGDHRDGLANELVRFCEANCFPNYEGSYVIAPKVTFYLNGENLITGILTSCKADWAGPLGLDGFYLELTLTLEITQISPDPLNYDAVARKRLIE